MLIIFLSECYYRTFINSDVALPTMLSLTAQWETSMLVNWYKTEGLFDGYFVQCLSLSNGVNTTIDQLSASATSYNCIGLTAGAGYVANITTFLVNPPRRNNTFSPAAVTCNYFLHFQRHITYITIVIITTS